MWLCITRTFNFWGQSMKHRSVFSGFCNFLCGDFYLFSWKLVLRKCKRRRRKYKTFTMQRWNALSFLILFIYLLHFIWSAFQKLIPLCSSSPPASSGHVGGASLWLRPPQDGEWCGCCQHRHRQFGARTLVCSGPAKPVLKSRRSNFSWWDSLVWLSFPLNQRFWFI